MTYQALARKWRPRAFPEVVGQSHVVSALTHALDNDRVHHAFLFTGTRGVGKTTLARLLAKSLNCEKGVSSTPCGECGACTSVDQGRFVDLLEIDAASRTRVDDTREILDNVQYAPTMGRYKVYLIDEVHMLSTSSFNALLKTLEEPPPHVKFLLATTDPQKLPATILSRCLQFNLRALTVTEISTQLAHILEQEQIDSDAAARELLARAADGSMRDALSLLDQAVAFSGARCDVDSVRDMLGMIEGNQVVELLGFLVDGNNTGLFDLIDTMRARSISFARALDDILILLHEVALAIQSPELAAERDSPWQGQLDIAARMNAEQVQLLYQIALIGKRDLPLAPDPARGFEMVMLRMLAFDPTPRGSSQATSSTARVTAKPVAAKVATAPAPGTPERPRAKTVAAAAPKARTASVDHAKVTTLQTPERTDPATDVQTPPPVLQAEADQQPETSTPVVANAETWAAFAENSAPSGMARELAMNLVFHKVDGKTIVLELNDSKAHLMNRNRLEVLTRAAGKRFGEQFKLHVELSSSTGEEQTPAVQRALRLQAEKETAVEGFINDPDISVFINQFDAEVVPDSVLPANQRGK